MAEMYTTSLYLFFSTQIYDCVGLLFALLFFENKSHGGAKATNIEEKKTT